MVKMFNKQILVLRQIIKLQLKINQ